MKNATWKKRGLCLLLVLCAATLSACQAKETFPTDNPAQQQAQAQAEVQQEQSQAQNVFSDAVVSSDNYDESSYDPASEEGGAWEPVDDVIPPPTVAPTMQSEYAGATPVIIDPIDKPTPTPLPKLTFTYATFDAGSLHMTFEAPADWEIAESESDTYTLVNPDRDMDYQAQLSIRAVPVNREYSKTELTKEIKGALDSLRSSGFKSFSPSNTANRTFLGSAGIYANYTGTLDDGVKVAGRIIAACVNKTLYILHVSYPQGYTETYVDAVFHRFTKTVKLN